MDKVDWLSEVQLRTAAESDLSALEWDGEFIHFRRLYKQVYENATEGKAVIWVADLNHVGLIGQLFVQLTSGRHELADGFQRGYIYGFRVKPAYRRSGLGASMLEAAERDLAARDYIWSTLNVSRDNPDALHFYRRHGYRVIGREPGDWSYVDHLGNLQEVHEPAYRMEKRIAQDVNNLLEPPFMA